eukprot:GEMP01078540.1.p1 GENE.GEMP01078540.1~~GEMP01078540.1.p1  ORF type:complete len:111 (+),score=18.88 GEMP01078540.1:756-1088(+)
METLATRIPWLEKEEELLQLQYALLSNGFKQLRPGGALVYSTCSFSTAQNEDLVRRFVNDQEECLLESLPFPEDTPCIFSDDRAMARFDPYTSKTSGLFVARIRKKDRII